MKFFKSSALLLTALLGGGLVSPAHAAESSAFCLRTNAQANSEGIFLSQVLAENPDAPLPSIRLADAPAFGQAVLLTRAQIAAAAHQAAPELALTNWSGAERIRVTRRARTLTEADLKELLTAQLQRDCVHDKGELELRFTRPWTAILAPDELLALKITELPGNGVTPNFIVRFELSAGREPLGSWQMAAQAKVWREILVAKSALKRGQLLTDAELVRERRDVLGLRDLLPDHLADDSGIEISDSVQAGAPLTIRSVRLRAVVMRGQVVDAFVHEGAMTISLKVEVLENGVPGQTVRVRNPQSRREFRGKVQNEQAILVSL